MRLTRRHMLLTASALIAAAPLARAAEVPLPPDARAFGATVEAMGKAPKPLRLAVLSFQGSSFWEAADKGIAAAKAYLAPLGSTVDYIQLGTALTAEAVVAGIDGALAKQYDGIAVVPDLRRHGGEGERGGSRRRSGDRLHRRLGAEVEPHVRAGNAGVSGGSEQPVSSSSSSLAGTARSPSSPGISVPPSTRRAWTGRST